MCALASERAAIGRRRRLAPRQVASEAALRALAIAGPQRPDDPLFTNIIEPDAFLRVIAQALDDAP